MIWISYCTTCRNRLHHLDATYLHNLHTQANLPVEFVLVNYGDEGKMDEWYYENKEQMEHVRYINVLDPVKSWQPSHAKNIAHRWAKGHIVCNLDADNIIADGLTEFLIGNLNVTERRVVALRDDNFCGRIAMKRRDFNWIGGYDERYSLGMAWEDTDIVQRAVDAKFKRVSLPDRFYVALHHSEADKCKGMADTSLSRISDAAHGLLLKYRPSFRANPTGWGRANVRIVETIGRADLAV